MAQQGSSEMARGEAQQGPKGRAQEGSNKGPKDGPNKCPADGPNKGRREGPNKGAMEWPNHGPREGPNKGPSSKGKGSTRQTDEDAGSKERSLQYVRAASMQHTQILEAWFLCVNIVDHCQFGNQKKTPAAETNNGSVGSSQLR